MFARVSTLQGSPDGIDLVAKQAQESVIPAAQKMDGYKGILLLGDRGSGKAMSVTLWETEAAMRASEETANKLRSEASDAAGEEIVSVERFEVLIDLPDA